NESHVRVFHREEVHNGYFAHHIVEHGHAKCPCDIANLSRDPPIVPVNLDTAEAIVFDRGGDELAHAAAIAIRMHEREARIPGTIPRDDGRHLAIGNG